MESNVFSVIDGLEYIQQFIKASSIYNECGKNAAWFSQRYKHVSNRTNIYRFSEKDVEILNGAICSIAKKLKMLKVSIDVSRDCFLNELKDVLSIVKNNYIRDNVLSCGLAYWNNRTKQQNRTEGCYRFKNEEIDMMNDAIKNISDILANIRLTY